MDEEERISASLEADGLLAKAQAAVTEKYREYEELASSDGSRLHPDTQQPAHDATSPVPMLKIDAGRQDEKTIHVPALVPAK